MTFRATQSLVAASKQLHFTLSQKHKQPCLALHADVHGAVSWIESCRSSLSLHEARSDLASHISNGGRRMWHEDCGGALGHPNVLQHVKVLRDHHHLNDIPGADVIHITLKVEYLHTMSGTISNNSVMEC